MDDKPEDMHVANQYGDCENCERQIETMAFIGERWCSERCRKVLTETESK